MYNVNRMKAYHIELGDRWNSRDRNEPKPRREMLAEALNSEFVSLLKGRGEDNYSE
jgi:hypothetical protein